MANTASITAAFSKNDYSLIKNNLYDYIIEPRRAKLIPGFSSVKEATLDAGADEYDTKPIEFKRLLGKIKDFI